MTELKTLKDLPCYHEADCAERTDLKQEAIKWIKEFKSNGIILTNGLPVTVVGNERYVLTKEKSAPMVFWIKHFFNLTEEDLKC